MNLKPTLKMALNLFSEGFVVSKCNEGSIYNVLTGETQTPPKDVVDVLEFIETVLQESRGKIRNN